MVHYIFFNCFLSVLTFCGLINLLNLFDGFGWFAQVNGFCLGGQDEGMNGLRAHHPGDVAPVIVDVLFF